MTNAGKYNRLIQIVSVTVVTDKEGFQHREITPVLNTYASVKTTRGMTLIVNGTDFEKATVNFTIRYPVTVINRDMLILYRGKTYTIEYLNNVDFADEELEIQAKEVTH